MRGKKFSARQQRWSGSKTGNAAASSTSSILFSSSNNSEEMMKLEHNCFSLNADNVFHIMKFFIWRTVLLSASS